MDQQLSMCTLECVLIWDEMRWDDDDDDDIWLCNAMTCHVLECHGPPTAGWTIWVSCAGLLGHLGPLGPQAVEGEADIDPRRSNLSHWTWLRAATSATSKCFIVQSLFNFEKKSTSLNLIFSRTFRSRKKIVFLDISTSPGRRDWIHLDEAATPWMKFIPAKAMFDRMFTITDDLAPFLYVLSPFGDPKLTDSNRADIEKHAGKSGNGNHPTEIWICRVKDGQFACLSPAFSSLTYKMRRTWLEKSWIHPATLIYFTKISQLLLVNLVIWVWK